MDALKEIDFRLLLEQLPAIVWATDRDLCFHYARGAGLVALGLGADEVVGLSLSERSMAEFFENAETELFENAVIGLHWIGADGTILRANQAELDLLGYAVEEYVGHHIAEFHVDPELVTEILARLGRGETVDAWEARMRARDGSIKDVLISSNALWEDGHFVRTRGFTRDITDRRRMEEARRQAELQQHVASLAHAAAHEINNPLAVIYGQLDLIARTAAPETKPRLDASREAIARIAEILDRMNSLARLKLSQDWPADLPPMLDLKASSAADAGTSR